MTDECTIASAFLDIFQSHRVGQQIGDLGLLSVGDAYRVQKTVIDTRTSRGERRVGYKVGCTSDAIRRQFGLTEPICGCVMAPYVYHGNTSLNWADYCQPAVEPEFVLMIGKDLPNEVGESDPITHAIDCVAPGIEVHNYRFWFGEPTVQELIASNGIHAALVIGEQRVNAQQVDWDLEGVSLLKNNLVAASGVGAEIMGGPLRSLKWLVNHLVRRGEMLKAGDLVIPGSPVELVTVERNDKVTARFTRVGEVEAIFE